MARPKKNEEKEGMEKDLKKAKKIKKEFATVTGMRDILPQDQKYWDLVVKVGEKIALDYGYGKIDTPILEYTEVFTKGLGKVTDLIEKEMYSFEDRGGDNLTIRPEGTASIVRAYIQHGMINQTQPVKLYSYGPMFRHDKPQSGRYRQLHQFGYEAIGEINPALDAQMILMGWNMINEVGLDSIIQVNSIGCPNCREEYKKALVKYYKTKVKVLCPNCQRRLQKNPLRLLDCKEEECVKLKIEAPQILDYLDEECKSHLMKVIEYLDELDLPYVLNTQIVRGLDYYTKTVFEYWAADDAEGKSALGGGGRYDGLVQLLGGRQDVPACGFAMGMDRVVSKLREKEVVVPDIYQPDIFVAQLGEAAKKKALKMYERLRQKGFKLSQAFYKDNLKAQLEIANKLKVKYTLIMGQKEVGDGTVLVRDMDGGIQENVDYNKIDSDLAKRVQKWKGDRLDISANEEQGLLPKVKRPKADYGDYMAVDTEEEEFGNGSSGVDEVDSF